MTRHPAGMHCPSRDDAFVSSSSISFVVNKDSYVIRKCEFNAGMYSSYNTSDLARLQSIDICLGLKLISAAASDSLQQFLCAIIFVVYQQFNGVLILKAITATM